MNYNSYSNKGPTNVTDVLLNLLMTVVLIQIDPFHSFQLFKSFSNQRFEKRVCVCVCGRVCVVGAKESTRECEVAIECRISTKSKQEHLLGVHGAKRKRR